MIQINGDSSNYLFIKFLKFFVFLEGPKLNIHWHNPLFQATKIGFNWIYVQYILMEINLDTNSSQVVSTECGGTFSGTRIARKKTGDPLALAP